MPKSEVTVTTDFNITNSSFSDHGFLQYVIRYGGVGGKSDLVVVADRLNNTGQGKDELLPLRKYVLDKSDFGVANQIINRMFITTGVSVSRDASSLSTLTRRGVAEIKTLNSAVKCPPTLTVTPVVSLHRPGNPTPFCTNKGLGVQLDKYRVVLSSVNLEVSSNKNVGGGAFPVYHGTYTLKITELNKQKQNSDILKKIGSDPSLSYIFNPNNEYEIHLVNQANSTVVNDAKKLKKTAEYNALTRTNLKLTTRTIKYELTSWKPQQNEAIFTITFADTTTAREALVKDGAEVKGELTPEEQKAVSEQKKAKGKVKGIDLTQAILLAIRNNGSLFNYEFVMYDDDDVKNTVTFYQDYYSEFDETNQAQRIRNQIGERNKLIKKTEKNIFTSDTTVPVGTRSFGSFFLMRSLLAAIMQVASQKHTTLDKTIFKNFITPAADKAYLFIDESSVASELGTGVLGLGESTDDLRSTLESMVIPFEVFDKFMEEMFAKTNKVTLDYFLEEVLTDLVQRVLLSSRSRTTRRNYQYDFYPAQQGFAPGANTRTFNMTPSIIREAVADGYKASFRQLVTSKIKNPEEPYKTKNQIIKQDDGRFNGKSARARRPNIVQLEPSQVGKIGKLRIKKISNSSAQEAFNIVGTFQDQRSYAILANLKGVHHSNKISQSSFEVFLNSDETALHKQGIMLINPFMRNALNESINYRIASEGASTPFRFSILENKHKETIRRLRAGDPNKSFIKNIHTVDVTFKGTIGFAPFRHRLFFPPSYFYGGGDRGKLSDDKFGFAGVYVINKVSISLQEGQGDFEVSLSAAFEKEIREREDRAAGNTKPKRKVTTEEYAKMVRQRDAALSSASFYQKQFDKTSRRIANGDDLEENEQNAYDQARKLVSDSRNKAEQLTRKLAETEPIARGAAREIPR